MNKKERQAYLQELMDKELEELRLKCFPYKRRDFLYYPVTIEEDETMGDTALGEYITENKDNHVKLKHRIKINPCLIDDIINYKWIFKYCLDKKYYKRRLKQTIKHELVHAFVYEEWEGWTDIEGVHRDASPIFLATLKFLKGTSNHDAAESFMRKGQLYLQTIEHVWEKTKYEDFRIFLGKLLIAYEKEIREINVANKNATKFVFSHRNSGLKGSWNITSHVFGREGKMDVSLYNFEIGSRILPQDLKKLTHRKIANKNFELKNEDKYYCFSKEKVVKLWEKKNY